MTEHTNLVIYMADTAPSKVNGMEFEHKPERCRMNGLLEISAIARENSAQGDKSE